MPDATEISPAELLGRLRNGFEPLLLDVRNPDDYASWRMDFIRDQVNIPYIDFIETPDESAGKVPQGREIVALCAKGGASAYVANILKDKGITAVNVAGGMKAWGNLYVNTPVWAGNGAEVIQFNRVGKGCLSYLLVSGAEAVVIDPARHVEQYLAAAKERGVKIKYVFDTHLHADHISGGHSLAQVAGAEYRAGSADMDLATTPCLPAGDGEVYTIGGMTIEVVSMASPGHTPGSTCFLFADKLLFTGDTLFLSSMGRPDLGGHASEWVYNLWDTIRKFEKLGDDVLIAPSHTTGTMEMDERWRVIKPLGALRKTNPLLTIGDKERFAAKILSCLPAEPEDYQNMRHANLGQVEPDEETKERWELGRNRCAVESAAEARHR
ncbi:MAG: MBL fold metallo-hydrolase [Nitrospinae bacterium]|nr:MBL fold metallo-hydrolase [Nitrospinota bacterium]